MLIPKSLKIGGHHYKVQFHAGGETCKDIGDCGMTVKTKGVIEISSDLIQSEQEQTLIHEIFHVMNSELDHALLDSLAQQIYQVLKDNGMLRQEIAVSPKQ